MKAWKKGEAKGELELQEKEKGKDEKEKFKAHGKIDTLYKDCSGIFRISGTAKVEVKEDKEKFKEKNVSFTGSITESEIKITIDGREFAVPAKINIKEEIEKEKK